MKLKPCYAKLLEICTRAKYTHREAVGGGGVCGCGDSDVNGGDGVSSSTSNLIEPTRWQGV